jgi:hypothetical protein
MVRYKMVGRDVNSSPVQYRTWVMDQPDFTGQFYTGRKSGPDPLFGISIFELNDPNAVFDFNLPDPLVWSTTRKLLPNAVSNSQLAIIDGYAYLFGGESDGYIYKASLDNPADWEKTDSILPTPLSGSQLAVIGDTIYLFGGNLGGGDANVTDVIYTASISDPLNWVDSGSLLPVPLSGSQLGIIGDVIYLFGGYTENGPTSAIFGALASDPLNWSDTGSFLPNNLYASQIGIVDGYVYLFGGMNSVDTPITTIYRAETFDPLTWTIGTFGLPFASADAQFVRIGDYGYLFGPTVTNGLVPNTDYVRIMICRMTDPSIWYNTHVTIPGVFTQSQLAMIYDRVWLFGGNGSSIIFASAQLLKSNLSSSDVIAYGSITRTQYNSTSNPLDLFSVIGFPNWKTDYGS